MIIRWQSLVWLPYFGSNDRKSPEQRLVWLPYFSSNDRNSAEFGLRTVYFKVMGVNSIWV